MPYHINHICVLCDFFIDDLNKTCGVSNTCRKLKMRIFMCEKRTEVALALPTTPVNERQCALKEGPPAKQSAPVKQSDVSSCTVILPHHRPISIFFCMHHWQLPFQTTFAAVGSSYIATWETNKANEANVLNMLTLRGAWSASGIMYRNNHCCRDTTQRHPETRHVQRHSWRVWVFNYSGFRFHESEPSLWQSIVESVANGWKLSQVEIVNWQPVVFQFEVRHNMARWQHMTIAIPSKNQLDEFSACQGVDLVCMQRVW